MMPYGNGNGRKSCKCEISKFAPNVYFAFEAIKQSPVNHKGKISTRFVCNFEDLLLKRGSS